MDEFGYAVHTFAEAVGTVVIRWIERYPLRFVLWVRRICPGCFQQGGRFALPDKEGHLLHGITCQVCARDFTSNGSELAPPRHRR